MQTKLVQVQNRIDELEALATEVASLAARLKDGETGQPDLSIKGQRWYRGAREMLVQGSSSALAEFDQCYDSSKVPLRAGTVLGGRHFTDIEQYIAIGTNNSWNAVRRFGTARNKIGKMITACFQRFSEGANVAAFRSRRDFITRVTG